jgi:hypothetical protein
MSEPNKDLKRIRAIRSGNRGVVTRYSKEAIELLYQGNETNKDRLRTIANLLNEKIIRLKELDAQVLELCEIDDIEREIEETEEMFSRASDVSSRIEKFTSATGKVIDKPGPTTSKTSEIITDVVSNRTTNNYKWKHRATMNRTKWKHRAVMNRTKWKHPQMLLTHQQYNLFYNPHRQSTTHLQLSYPNWYYRNSKEILQTIELFGKVSRALYTEIRI